MLVTLPYCLRDHEITLKLFDWIHQLGGCKPRHELWLLHDHRCPPDAVKAILASAQRSFEPCGDIIAGASIDGWPEGANYMFRTVTATLAYTKHKHFLWMEPDAIPLTPDWLDRIEDEYVKVALPSKKPFMGDRVEVKDIPLHMSGVGVYPNPVYELAGEAYRAAEVAWDMAAKDQIVPNAHFTDLIEHAWKHPEFTNLEELETQIDPNAVLFHASKDGSLIKLLQQNLNAVHVQAEPSSEKQPTINKCESGGEARESTNVKDSGNIGPNDSRGGVQSPVYDIFIRTYPVDYPWLQFCLRSINQYAIGFRKVWIVSPEPPVGEYQCGNFREWKVMNEEASDGYLSQQIHKLYADTITNYEADYILHIDSDTLFTRPVTPKDFFKDEKLIWYYTPYEQTETPWKPITEKFMKVEVKNEFMRRLPMMVPRWLYDQCRKNCFDNHKMILSDYIRKQPYREFSEFNVLGAVAWIHYPDKFQWVNTTTDPMPEPLARQFFSWGGLTEDVKAEIQTILSGGANVPEAITHDNPASQGVAPLPAQNFQGWGGIPCTDGKIYPPASVLPEDVKPPLVRSNDDGYESPGEHVRWLADYVEGSPSRRQYVMQLLDKVKLKKLTRGRRGKKKVAQA